MPNLDHKKRILVISHDKLGKAMAGPGMRYHQIATELSKHFEVSLATFNPEYIEELGETSYKYFDINVHKFQEIFQKYEVIFALWLSPEMISFAKANNIQLIFDMYAPIPVEELVGRLFAKRISPAEEYNYAALLENQRRFFSNADLVVCSNNAQKNFWTGYAFASGAVSPSNYQDFPVYNRIALLPMGLNKDELSWRTGQDLIRSRLPKIKTEDFVIIWTGGIWDWFDGQTPIKAMAILRDQGLSNIKLVFLGTRHPNKEVPEMDETLKTINLAKKLNLVDEQVFFFEGWIPYRERIDYFSSADAALYSHKPSIEANFSYRTRVLDHILVGLPTIATAGDCLSDMLEEKNLGLSVEPGNPTALASAISKLAGDKSLAKSIHKSIEAERDNFTWQATTKELVSFLKNNHTSRKPFTLSPVTTTTKDTKIIKLAKRAMPRRLKELIKNFIY